MSLRSSACALALIVAAGACASDGLTAPVIAPAAAPESRVVAALQGRLPGARASAPSSGRIRFCSGRARLDGRQPLFVLDDVPMTHAEMLATGLDVRQVVEIYILKPASAVERYGDRARDGAVMITTRRL